MGGKCVNFVSRGSQGSKAARETSGPIRFLKKPGCSKIVRSSHPQKAPRRRSSATPHKEAFEDGGEVAVFQQPAYVLTRIGMITVVSPPHCRRRWMAKAVSLCRRRW